MSDNFVEIDGFTYLQEAQAIISTVPSREMFYEPDKPITIDGYQISPWGESNDMPQLIIEKAEKSEIVQSNLLFNIESGYGQGIKPMRRIIEGKKLIGFEEIWEGEVVDFFSQNDINGFFLEQLSDLHFFYNVFPEFILSGDKRKIVSLGSKEAAVSRWDVMDPPKGVINKNYTLPNGTTDPGRKTLPFQMCWTVTTHYSILPHASVQSVTPNCVLLYQ